MVAAGVTVAREIETVAEANSAAVGATVRAAVAKAVVVRAVWKGAVVTGAR